MRFSDFIVASLVAAPLVAAHGDAGIPKIFGMPKHLNTREFMNGQKNVATPARSPRLQSRQGGTAEGRCGASFNGASCAASYCCSAEGYCGNTSEHCAAPDCQINYGPGCDANQTPAGSSTRNDARPQLGNIEYGGVGIRSCVKPKTVAITYDDGPYIYTTEVMDLFRQYNAKATFFITGNNIGKGAIDQSWRGVIQDMYSRGHQIASHTWSHQNLDQITSEQRYDQMVKNEMALRNILGKYPTYMRPPYSACDSAACQADLKALGYVITSFDLDTDDYNQLTTEKIETAKANFKNGIDSALPNGDQLAIAHDIHELTARNLTPYMLKYVYDNGFTAVTVGECMGDPEANWYRASTPAPPTSSSASSSAPVPTPTGPTSTNGACGNANPDGKGQSCIGFIGPNGLSQCCSQYGYCGNSADYCQSGCNSLFGKCGTQPSVSASASVSASSTSSAPVPTISLPTSQDATCGATAGFTCKGFTIGGVKAECCSQYNYCGNTDAYCGTGCNPLYGNCGSSISSSSASASISASVSASASVSSSRGVSSSASSSALSSSKGSSIASSSAPTSSKASSTASVSATGFISKSSSASASPSVTSKASSSSVSASVSKSSSTSAKPSSVSASSSVSKTASSSGSVSASVSKTASSSGSGSASISKTASSLSSASASISKPGSSSAATSHSVTAPQVSSTPAPSSSKPASSSAQPSASSVISKSASSSSAPPAPTFSSGDVYPNRSTISTVVRPSSTPCDTSSPASPTPTKPVVSKDGKCGKDNGGQTCAGYMNGFGWKIECCCKESGRCSTDPWACGIGCDKAYGKCWY